MKLIFSLHRIWKSPFNSSGKAVGRIRQTIFQVWRRCGSGGSACDPKYTAHPQSRLELWGVSLARGFFSFHGTAMLHY